MNNTIKKLAIFILTSFLINSFILSTNVFASNSETIQAAKEEITKLNENSCENAMKLDGETPTVVIKFYEPLTDAGNLGNKAKIIDCYEHTYQNDPTNDDVDITKFTVSSLSTTNCSEAKQIENTVRSCTKIQVLLSNSGTLVMYTYIGFIYRFATNIVGLIAVMIVIFSGIQIATSGGDTEVLSSAKSRIIKSLGGIAVLFLSGLILYTVNPTFYTIATNS